MKQRRAEQVNGHERKTATFLSRSLVTLCLSVAVLRRVISAVMRHLIFIVAENFMHTYMLIAGLLALVISTIHSVLGEILIFRRMRVSGIVPTNGAPSLRERHVRILWASWHIVTVFGWAFAAIVLRLAFPTGNDSFHTFVQNTIITSMLMSALLVLFGTKKLF